MTAGPTVFGAIGKSAVLAAFAAVLWLMLAGPAWWLSGAAGLEGLTIAALLCVVPGWLVFLLASGYGLANFPVGAVLGGMLLRMVFVLVGTLLVLWIRSHLGLRSFLVWLIVFYLATLAVETGMILKGRAPAR